MEVYINDLPQVVEAKETSIAIVQAISDVVHRPPFRKPGERKCNFDVKIREKYRPRSIRRSERNRDQLSKRPRLCGTLTFTSSALGNSFLRFSELNTITIFNNIVVYFQQSLRGGRKAVPHPELVRHLRETPFKEPAQMIKEFQEQESLQIPLLISCIEFGRTATLSTHPPRPVFYSEHSLYLPTDVSELQINTDKDMVILRWRRQNYTRSLVIKMRSISQIEAHSLSVILWLENPPSFEVIRKVTNASGVQFDRDFHQEEDEEVRFRVQGFTSGKAVIPFVSTRLKITFADEEAFKRFCTKRESIRLPAVSYRERLVIEKDSFSSKNLESVFRFAVCSAIPVAFQLEALLHNGILQPPQICFVCQKIEYLDPLHAERALIELSEKYDSDHIIANGRHGNDEYSDLDSIISRAIVTTKSNKSPLNQKMERGDCFPCRSVIITPTKFTLEGPFVEQSNSILRLYKQTENFIRVSLRDENGLILRNSRDVEMSHLLKTRYLPFLTDGIHLCGRKFDFLGYSNSALKDHQAWFVCPFDHESGEVSASTIRSKLGDFSKVINIPARYMARIAQAFTSTTRTITLQRHEIQRMDDVERNNSCFTDGCGTMSKTLADEVHRALLESSSKRSRNLIPSSCYQIRLGGYKGMLSVDPTLVGRVVKMRPSMDKFDAPDSMTLDIAGAFHKPLNAYLNRPLIKILEDLVIDGDVFMALQKQMMHKVEASRTRFDLAAKLMQQSSIADVSDLPAILRALGDLLGNEAEPNSEFIEDCYDLMVMQCLRDLKYRARIHLEKSYNLVGVSDEDNYLAPLEIYACIQYPSQPPIYLKGPIAISRSPCLHPGDVRVVYAVGELGSDVAPRLSELVNCVAFSVKGHRSLPSCLGGGDLDGDLYTLIGLPELIPEAQYLHQPASYQPPEMKKLDRECTIEDGAQFFLDYIRSDLVGIIASRHLHLADQLEAGTKDPLCKKLAELHSDAVDYPKTGFPVSVASLPLAPQRNKPDFMCPEHNSRREGVDYYQSDKILGRLFRQIPAEKIDMLSRSSQILGPHRPNTFDGRYEPRSYGSVDPENNISSALEERLERNFSRCLKVNPRLKEEFRSTLAWFSSELMKICRLNTLSSRRGHHLSETEAFLGVLTMTTPDKALRRTTIYRLKEQTLELYSTTRSTICGKPPREGFVSSGANDDADTIILRRKRIVSRAYAAWVVATEAESGIFGAHSFAFLALGLLL
ncbi:RNA dependent RNA polymerase-domain-containing protein, partial [Phakopsora pachyrhizi]